ncbi:hypothetical protein [Flavisphingomonas formosensis]|nr:hypothetical protein [Sphingomonas formosensis]
MGQQKHSEGKKQTLGRSRVRHLILEHFERSPAFQLVVVEVETAKQ